MVRPKGSKNHPKNGEPGPGHNGGPPDLTDDQKQALFFQHLKKVRAFKQTIKSTAGQLRAAYKLAKSELGADARKMIEDALALEADDGQVKMEAEIARKAQVARWMGLPLGAQPDLFDGNAMPATDRAFAAGKAARLNGDPLKPPYDPSVPQFNAWAEGWHDGERALIDAQRRDDEAAFPDVDSLPSNENVPDVADYEEVRQ